jgi:RNA polymerase sigma-70 factor (ECF subfamily)
VSAVTDTPAKRALELHRRVLAGDPTASAKLAETMLGPLKAHLRKHHSSALDAESRDDLAVDAVLAYLQAPEKFDPSKAGLFRYLTLIAENDLKDAIRRRTRHHINSSFLSEMGPR